MRLRRIVVGLAALAAALFALPAAAGAAPVLVGAAAVDASWHVGASAGQYASGGDPDPDDPAGAFASVEAGDPHQHTTRRRPSYGIQSRLSARAIVVQGGDGSKFALVKNDQYIPQDLLWRRTAQILESEHADIGIGRSNLTMNVTHDHSSPMYSSTGWGVWVFQDVFDFRYFEYMARRMAQAVVEADRTKVPAKIGASVSQYSFPQRNVPGPAIADDGTPAGYPNDYTDHDLIVVRFDRVDNGKPIANLVNYSVHPEDLSGNDLISADYVGPMQRMADRGTGAVTIYTQAAVGSTEPEDNRWHNIHERAFFSHGQYAQSEFKARGIASQIIDTSEDVAKGTPDDPARFVPFRSDFGGGDVKFMNRWFPGPASHPYPGISSCRSDAALQGDPRFPILGFPDCEPSSNVRHDYFDNNCRDFAKEFDQPCPANSDAPFEPIRDAGITTDTIQVLGIPVPENYSAPAYTGLEEDVSVHLQAFKIGDILFTVCSCEQWADQAKNIKTRTDQKPDNQWNGFDWPKLCNKVGDNWDCPRPGSNQRMTISDALWKKINAQINNDAAGWDDPAYLPYAESEPTDPALIKGNYTHDDKDPTDALGRPSASLGFPLTFTIAMANDYNGYIATYREYQRGDHYRKALTAWGPHSSDYMATRLVNMGRYLRKLGAADALADPYPTIPGVANDIVIDAVTFPGGAAKTTADLQNNDNRATVIGQFAQQGMAAYEASLPDDRDPKVVKQPDDVERFNAAFFTWVGGSNFTDQPDVRVQRFVDGKWVDWADQTGEIPVTLKFPPAENKPAYRVGGETFEWTAHYEAFVSRYDLLERPLASPLGSYRFRVRGQRRKGGQNQSYEFTSREFQVLPWTGITLDDFALSDGAAGFKVGPRRTIKVGSLDARLGPIDYPDTYNGSQKAAYIGPDRKAFRDPEAPNDPNRIEWYCIPDRPDDKPQGCSFRPWLDVGDLDRVVFTYVSSSGKVERVAGKKVGGLWVAGRDLRRGEGAYVEAGDACDVYGNYNGKPTAMVGNTDAVADKPPEGYSCVPKLPPGSVPGEGGGGSGGSGGSGGGGAGGGGSGGSGGTPSFGSNPLGLPSTKRCADRRRFSFKIHQPPRRRIIAVNVFVNGKRKLTQRGKKITRVTIKRLPSTRTFVVRIVALTNRGDRVISTRRYKGCKKGRPHTHVERGKKKKK